MTSTRRLLTALITCSLGQACSPLVFQIVSEGDEHGPPDTDDSGVLPPEPSTDDPPPGTTEQPPEPTEPTDSGPVQPPEPGCFDGDLGPDETDIDCGGPCAPCEPGRRCLSPKDCVTGICFDELCGFPGCLVPEDCPPIGPCMHQLCLPDGECMPLPANNGEPCEDGDPCTLKDGCFDGKCAGLEELDCSGFSGPCRTGVCNPQTGNCAVEWASDGSPCEDGKDCTFDETCSLGECAPNKPPIPELLRTDFTLAGGWIAEPPWQIGPAEPSFCGVPKTDDPAMDHSMDASDHVAGAAIGGCMLPDAFPEVCLVSPPIDVALLPGPLELRYWSVLSNAGGSMESRVDMLDPIGKTWVPLASITDFVVEGDWTEHVHPLGIFKEGELRVRFCHRAEVPHDPVGGWSIDDLSVGPPLCF